MITTNPPWIEFETMAAIFKIATSDHPRYELPVESSDYARDILRLCFILDTEKRPSAEELLRHKFCTNYT